MFVFSNLSIAEDRQEVGNVSSSVGEWLQDGKKVEQGNPVYAGAIVTLNPDYRAKNPNSGSIVIHLYSKETPRIERSPEKSDFDTPIKLEPIGEESTPWERFLRAVGGLFTHEPEKYMITAVRGAESQNLQEAVLKLEDGKVDLTPAFKMVRPGKYLAALRWIGQKEKNTSNSFPDPQEIECGSDGATPVAISGLRPGLWRLSLLRRQDERPLGDDAWVLICSPTAYEQAINSFKPALELTQSWGEGVSSGEVKSFLRTCLDLLDQQTNNGSGGN
jgi:hypothetical protein